MAKISLCIIATNKYRQFLPGLIESGRKHLKHDVTFHVFSDGCPNLYSEPNVRWHAALHAPWPLITLLRFHTMWQARASLDEHVFYVDADARFIGDIGDEILSDLVGVRHGGYASASPAAFPYERNRRSAAFVPHGEGRVYCTGSFQGGRRYLDAMTTMKKMVEQDLAKHLIPAWWDESVWNRYLVDNPPTLILPPAYHCIEGAATPGPESKILALKKDHDEIRQE